MPILIHTYTLSFGVDAHTNACACGMTNLTSLAPGRSLIEFPRSDAPHDPTFSFILIKVIGQASLFSMLYFLTWPMIRDAHWAEDDKFVIPSHMDIRTSIHTYVHIHAYIRTYAM